MRRFDVLSVWWESSGESSGLRVVIVLVELPVSVFVFFFFLCSFFFGLVVLWPQHACIVWLLY
jgi:hypothetical protein